MRRTLRNGLVLVLLPLAPLELGVRLGVLDRPPMPWYDEALKAACSSHVDVAFIGSSRVAAAIVGETFAEEVGRTTTAPVRAINVGRGYATLAEHDLLLRRLYQQCGANLEKATVFVEAPAGLPDFATFRDPWVHPDEPWLITPVIDAKHVLRMWTESETPFNDKIEVSARLFQAVNYIDAKRRRLFRVGDGMMRRLDEWHRAASEGRDAATDLSSAGGVLTNRAAVERARQLAVELAPTTFKSEHEVADWSTTVLVDINTLVREHGGRLIVFRMPLSSVQQVPYSARARLADAETFRREATRLGIDYLHVEFKTTDEDFPDYWHLRSSRAAEFTRRVAIEYVRATRASDSHARLH